MPGIGSEGKLFFKKIAAATLAAESLCRRCRFEILIVWQIIGSKFGRRSQRFVPVVQDASSVSRDETVFIRRDDRSAPGRHTQNQFPI